MRPLLWDEAVTRALICQCEHCGRVRIGGRWVRDDSVAVDVLGFCPLCGELRKRLAALRYMREGRKLLRDRTRGYKTKPKGDVFKGMRGE